MANVLVTGANGAFGGLTVAALRERGHAVVAAMRDAGGRNRGAAEGLLGSGARIVEMDVAEDASVAAGMSQALESVDSLDVVVNNAGIGVLGPQEAFTPDDWRRVFEVNVFGAQRVIRAVLPHMRGRRSGLIVQVSSLLGRIAIPFYGPYNASKWALEAMSENYRVELSGFGVDVAIVEPGGYPTGFIGRLVRPGDGERAAALGEMTRGAEEFLHGFEQALAANPAQDPRNVATAIADLIETPAGKRPFRTIVDRMGMGEAIRPYNDQLETLTTAIYTAFGIGRMRRLKVEGR